MVTSQLTNSFFSFFIVFDAFIHSFKFKLNECR